MTKRKSYGDWDDEQAEDLQADGSGDALVDSDGDVVAPETHICLEGAYYKAADPRQRVVVHGGRNYEHTHDDALGVWCYRNM